VIKLPSIATQWERPRPRLVKPALRPLRYPYGPEQQYAAVLLYTAKAAATAVRTQVIPNLKALTTYAGKRLPRADDLNDRLQELIAQLRAEFGVSTRQARRVAIEFLDATSAQHAGEFVKAYGDALNVNPMVGNEAWLPQAMDVVTEENVGLIKSIPDHLFDDVEKLVSNSLLHGTRVEELALQIFQRFGVTENRAMLIARDQCGKWQGNLSRFRQIDAGITEYEWLTVGDERVRPKHRARDGKTYSWASDEIRPGQEVQCRCQAIPKIPDWED
jgi:SPP1 gp7 family putative phage head morphogenesis protein